MFECVKREDRSKKFACKAIRKERVQRHASLHKAKRNIKRVDTEVRALKRFSHAAVVRLYDVIQSPQHVYLVLERGDRDLYAFLDDYKDGCTEDVVRSVMRIAALGLRHCHAQGIAHRDLKPENLLLDSNYNIKIADFGFAGPVNGRVKNGYSYTKLGTLNYMAPEIILN